ncbi:hypothetical protein [Gorillibacterium timonense]|uniref:hypothetical protein n=1 Tax=Gorillibacterium timonense TaxID=1689269 RepID=UPI00071D0216|nr:hypothetical protein [Gorillibacterium timonense]
MAFCTQCGIALEEGVQHDCPAAQNQPEVLQSGFSRQSIQIDKNALLLLVKNPQAALSLDPAKDKIYGIIGLGASLLGFFLWGLMLKLKLIWAYDDQDGLLGDFLGNTVKKMPIASHLLLLGILSLAAFIVLLWFFGNGKGTAKRSLMDAAIYLGAMQLLSGAGFVVAGVVALVWVPGSSVIVGIFLLLTLLMTTAAALDLFAVPSDKRLVVLGGFAAVYAIVILISINLLIKDFGNVLL